VDHDAFQYFEVRFGLNAVAALRDSAAKTAGAARLRAVETQVEATDAHCIFRSAADARGLPDQLAAESGLRLAALDELGVGIAPGPDHYEAMLRAMAVEARACLTD
jgi:zinc transport system substrate-binding protein